MSHGYVLLVLVPFVFEDELGPSRETTVFVVFQLRLNMLISASEHCWHESNRKLCRLPEDLDLVSQLLPSQGSGISSRPTWEGFFYWDSKGRISRDSWSCPRSCTKVRTSTSAEKNFSARLSDYSENQHQDKMPDDTQWSTLSKKHEWTN